MNHVMLKGTITKIYHLTRTVYFTLTVTSATPTTNQQQAFQGQYFWSLINNYQTTSASLALLKLDCATAC